MGYTTEFDGQFKVEPPLNAEEIAYLTKFSESRRMRSVQGPYYVDRDGDFGQSYDGVIDYNTPPDGQPGLWCQWVPTENGEAIEWNECEKFYRASEWIAYLIEHFLKPGALARVEMPFLRDHIVNGTVQAQGEDPEDLWTLSVTNNVVSRTVLV